MLKYKNIFKARIPYLLKNFSTLEKSFPENKLFEHDDITGLIITMQNKPGILSDALQVFSKNKVNLTYINSRPTKFSRNQDKMIEFFIDLEGKLTDEPVKKSLTELKDIAHSVDIFETEEVPWFPKSILDLNKMGRKLLSGGEELSSDHPGFNDPIYKQRREELAQISNSYSLEDDINIPTVTYTKDETFLWGFMWDKLIPLHKKYACQEFNSMFENFEKELLFKRSEIPQLKNISAYLKDKTGTIFRPVGGLLTQREFLNGLAFRVFHSTQYLRHLSKPLYTPEPDIVHEFMGHAPLFACKDFADFSQLIGMASLAVSDEDIKKLGTLYWFTVEFGLCLQNGQRKAYGAGILSSPEEIEWSMSDKPNVLPFDINQVAQFPYSITEIQNNFFLAPSFKEMKNLVLKYTENIKRPFNISYNVVTQSMEIDRKISMKKESIISENEKLF